ncbi:MAG: restriction endonuclease [Armatimonadetes bacterium]|nr:restriction endonuclease [Armatimonadota bacterium]
MNEIPSWDGFMVPVLRIQADGGVRVLRDLISAVSDAIGLTHDQRTESLSSGQQVVANRIGWATSYLTRVGALERPTRGKYAITEFGRRFLHDHPVTITEADLRAVAKPDDQWWVSKSKLQRENHSKQSDVESVTNPLDPVEMIAQGIELIQSNVRAGLIERLVALDPAFFEQAVVRLLVAMGYGGTGGQAAATRLVNDGGIDGVIDQDVLGLSKVYVQAKRYARDNSVGRPEVQAFVGALSGKAEQGVMITTGRFSTGAREYAERDARVRIILIDGPRLVDLMVKYRVGVQVRETLAIVDVDEDFFE